jgi:hypothetical protein
MAKRKTSYTKYYGDIENLCNKVEKAIAEETRSKGFLGSEHDRKRPKKGAKKKAASRKTATRKTGPKSKAKVMRQFGQLCAHVGHHSAANQKRLDRAKAALARQEARSTSLQNLYGLSEKQAENAAQASGEKLGAMLRNLGVPPAAVAKEVKKTGGSFLGRLRHGFKRGGHSSEAARRASSAGVTLRHDAFSGDRKRKAKKAKKSGKHKLNPGLRRYMAEQKRLKAGKRTKRTTKKGGHRKGHKGPKGKMNCKKMPPGLAKHWAKKGKCLPGGKGRKTGARKASKRRGRR